MIRDRLFTQSPYEGFDATPHPDDLQGWGSDDPLLPKAVEAMRPSLVCEVGSWKGRSAINMARAAKKLGLNTEIVCVDTWLGSPEHWLERDRPSSYPSLRIEHGLPQIYYTFLANVVRAGVQNIITPFPTTSDNAAVIFRALKVRFDLVYLDGAHEYTPVKRDIETYYDLLADNALLIGDDYAIFPGVTKAADEFVKERDIPISGRRPGKFFISKGTPAVL